MVRTRKGVPGSVAGAMRSVLVTRAGFELLRGVEQLPAVLRRGSGDGDEC